MSDAHVPLEQWTAPDTLVTRCGELGLLVYSADERGRVLATPADPPPAGRWCRASTLMKLIEQAVREAFDTDDWTPRPLFDGCHLLPLCLAGRGRGLGAAAVLMLDSSLATAPVHATICADTGLGSDEALTALGDCLRPRHASPEELLRMLQWTRDDTTHCVENDLALLDLSSQLSDAYEQISAIYRIGRSMNWLNSPRQFVKAVSTQLLHLLDYQWIAMQYVPSVLALPGVGSQLIVVGELPCNARAFSSTARQLIDSWRSDQWSLMLEKGENELATLVGAQVVAECITHDGVIVGAIFAGNKVGADREATSIDTQLLDVVSEFVGVFHQNAVRYDVQRSMFLGTVRALSSAIDAKDPYTRGHSQRVGQLGSKLAQAIGMSDEKCERVYIAGIVHDIGKIGVPESVLGKSGRLTPEEWDQMKRHPVIGYEILRDIPPMYDVLPGVLHHHERWDGDGYPDGLAGHDIPLLGRLLAVVDAFDAMSSDRAYRARRTRPEVLQVLRDGAASQWDADLVEAFLTIDLDAHFTSAGRLDDRHRAA
ncbi:MAG: HD-GYP domain-containing protein [Planctomycetota bacterium]|jgi:HD-GYP domain-containing protein (c-di-GMP phosphodiesterase class II)